VRRKTSLRVADLLRQNAKGGVRTEGHTDGKGSPAYNQKLSVRHADAVKTWLLKQPDSSGLAS
jgi:outer membrane protein OmpA-like peptidoglycan-associated protein